MPLIHGAKSCLAAAKRYDKKDPLHQWERQLEQRRGHHRATVALANKLARIAWSVLARGRAFEVRKIDEAAAQSA
jgi:transposase